MYKLLMLVITCIEILHPTPLFLSVTAPGLHPVPGGVFPVPPAAVVLMKLLPPPICFQVCSPFSWQIFSLWVKVVIMYFFSFIVGNTKWGYFNLSDYWGLSFLSVKIGSFCTSGWTDGNFPKMQDTK